MPEENRRLANLPAEEDRAGPRPEWEVNKPEVEVPENATDRLNCCSRFSETLVQVIQHPLLLSNLAQHLLASIETPPQPLDPGALDDGLVPELSQGADEVRQPGKQIRGLV